MKAFFFFLLIPLLFYGGCKLLYPTHTYRQKLTVVVETPDGMKTASSAFLVQFSREPSFGFLDASGYNSRLYGEAAVVDLGAGRYLFALLTDNQYLAQRIFSDKARSLNPLMNLQANHEYVKQMTGIVQVPLKASPLLVTFEDVNDRDSIRSVDPADLAATFGEGFALREITLENTDDALTGDVVERVLGEWLNTLRASFKLHLFARQGGFVALDRTDFVWEAE